MGIKQLYTQLLTESKELILEPKNFWKKKGEGSFNGRVVTEFYIPMVFLAGIGQFLGEIIWNDEYLISYAFFDAIRIVVSYLAQFFILIPILQMIQNNYGGIRDRNRTGLVLVYSLFPFIAASFITGLFPGLYILSIVGLYGFYLYVLGTKSCMEIPPENQTKYIALSIFLIVLVFGMVNVVSWRILQSLYPYGA